MRTPKHVDYVEPTPEEREAGTWLRCTGCRTDWPLRLTRIGTRRCLNCARRAERERQERSRDRRAGRASPAAPLVANTSPVARAPEVIDLDDVRSEFGTQVSRETETAVDDLLRGLQRGSAAIHEIDLGVRRPRLHDGSERVGDARALPARAEVLDADVVAVTELPQDGGPVDDALGDVGVHRREKMT